ncbi:urease accessory protein UreD [Ornithobacterium rhinotracheale]|uniref:Urease accessory protein UreD n=3 Tax=Ornithobacterium rhinotracheale TaxID=28251 RepID=I4A1M4_ORNRL|nr:urease accessory protein UreD [Ornithobacterium rhinotracheale]AFL97858.1 urease accessory protein UreH [Ornithobacterium rhinotracheale DSM 15997]AIP99680.1 urease accessory protein UreD [Ornithobacterium rhinotracheale ORT-UMN 88]KGB65917.1 urease accessory protein UreD [Ornithobacterium rhinotracheale H06-030791]MCK0193847.1 urease accessory protein UreD [Ornithobacterium rhinotracheale]MCK0205666.1 urease accessory protein UreD [Ornithobacterium rhinotracheale]
MDCKLHIQAGFKNEKSYLKDVFLTRPFRLVPVGQRKNDNKLYAMIMSSSPGILSGDHYDLKIDLDAKTNLQIQSQSYQRLFNMDGEASQTMQVEVGDESFFSYVPHPIVPHENSTFKSKTSVKMGEKSRVILSEIITCGRKHHGELFKFKHFQNLMEIKYQDQLVLKDNVILKPQQIPISSIGILEEFTHQGTLVYYSTDKDENIAEWVEKIYEKANDNNLLEFGISAMQEGGFVFRALGQGGEAMYNFFLEIQDLIWEKN